MDQVRLIGETVFRCQRAPVRFSGTANPTQDTLQTVHTGKPLGSNSNLRGKPTRECPGQKAQARGDPRYRHTDPQCGDRILNRRIVLWCEMLKEYFLQDAELRRGRGRIQQPVPQRPSFVASQVVEW